MQCAGVEPNVQTYTSAIIVLAHNEQVPPSLCNLAITVCALADMDKIAQQPMFRVRYVLQSGCCEHLAAGAGAKHLFSHLAAWRLQMCALILYCCALTARVRLARQAERAMHVFRQMDTAPDVRPDLLAYNAIMTAHARGGHWCAAQSACCLV